MSFDSSRRAWLKYTTAFALAGLVHPSLAKDTANLINSEDVIFGGGRYFERKNTPLKFVLARCRLKGRTVDKVDVPFFPHGITPIQKSTQAYLFQKIGTGAGLVDLASMEFVEVIHPVKNRLFYGHGVVRNNILLSTETAENEQGAIGMRDAKNLAYIGDFPTYGANPHDCHLVEGGALLVVANGGGRKGSGLRPCVCYIDVESQRLIEKIEMQDARFNVGHLYPLLNRSSIVVSAPRRGLSKRHIGAVSLQGKSKKLGVLTKPSGLMRQLLGESLSVVAVPDKDIFVVTHPTPGLVTFWRLSSQKLLQTLNLPSARGLALSRDSNSVWVSFGRLASIVNVPLDTLMVDKSTKIDNTFFTGSHLLNANII